MNYRKLILAKIKKWTNQEDWIIEDAKNGNLLCITIASTDKGKTWKLKEWVNFFDISPKMMQKMTQMGYMTMMDAMKKIDKYVAHQGVHKFKKEKLNGYFKELLGKKIKGKQTVSIDIDKKEFLNNLKTLVSADEYTVKK